MASAGENPACAYCAGEMGRNVCVARKQQAPVPPLIHRVVRVVVAYLAVLLIFATLLQAFTPFPALSWLGNMARILTTRW
jgi:peptidoglycan/LPS O-acetylase OafA/YrhL